MGNCLRQQGGSNSEEKIDFKGGNVHVITSKESWDEKISEANKDGKIDFSSSWDIRATPTFFFLKDGQQLDKLVGANKPELEKKIVTFADSASVASAREAVM